MSLERPKVLSIAGFDPSGGAGILADIKTFEANGVYGFGVCSAITFQNELHCSGVEWLNRLWIRRQLEEIFNHSRIECVKVGIIEDLELLSDLLGLILKQNPDARVVWDPIVAATSGFPFHNGFESTKLESVLRSIFLMTPNHEEMRCLVPNLSEMDGARSISRLAAVLLKSRILSDNGHGPVVQDILFSNGAEHVYESAVISNTSKHGSGCVLSAAITASLAKGRSLKEACFEGREYTRRFLTSESGLLGYHACA